MLISIGERTKGGTPVSGDSEASTFMNVMTMDAAKRLVYGRSLKSTGNVLPGKK